MKPVEKVESTKSVDSVSNSPQKNSKKQDTRVKQEILMEELNQVTPAPVISAPKKSAKLLEIESILEEDLSDAYRSLPNEDKKVFRDVGESTASQIVGMIESHKLKMGKVVKLIKKWLLLIPGINRFFLEQEIKIKADKIKKLGSE